MIRRPAVPPDLYRAGFEASPRPLALLDAAGGLIEANPAFLALARRPLAALRGRRIGWVSPWRDGTAWLTPPTGPVEEVALILRPLPEGGTLVEIDPADSVRRAARTEDEKRAILENTCEFIGLLDADGRVLHANRAALIFIGLEDDAGLRGRPFADTPWWSHSDAERVRLIAAIARARAGEMVRFETSHPGGDGRLAVIDFSLRPVLDAEGRVVYLVPEGRDVTQRKRAEAELLSAKLEAEAASRAKSTFLATVSHELRTPLNAVIGFSEALLSRALGPLDPAQVQDYLDLIHTAGQHLGALINDILDVSRVELGHLDLADDEIDPADLVASVRLLLAPHATDSGIRLTTDLPPALPRFRGDLRRLRQALLNLVTNAIKFTPAGGRVTLRVRAAPDGLRIEVEDTGIGIPPEHHGRVWQPFFQADAEHARSHDGAGLGLAIVKRLIEAQGGAVGLDSTPGQGTRVSILLPPERILPARD
ncbi:ATP-binding protein [Phaeospirillum tilakii]|uniref:histidine kinase n=1 Tax=Phaeospirillum tilakii TaxID=741673 RepID=A0ABW5CGK0_9PROT